MPYWYDKITASIYDTDEDSDYIQYDIKRRVRENNRNRRLLQKDKRKNYDIVFQKIIKAVKNNEYDLLEILWKKYHHTLLHSLGAKKTIKRISLIRIKMGCKKFINYGINYGKSCWKNEKCNNCMYMFISKKEVSYVFKELIPHLLIDAIATIINEYVFDYAIVYRTSIFSYIPVVPVFLKIEKEFLNYENSICKQDHLIYNWYKNI